VNATAPWHSGAWRRNTPLPKRALTPAPPPASGPLLPSPGTSRRGPCPDGGIGRRTSFRCWRSQGRGGSSPLLGTNALKSLSKSSNRRSTQRVCYDPLLRFGAHSSGLSYGKTVRNGPRGCYGSIKNRGHHPHLPRPRLLHHRHHTDSCGLRLRVLLTQSLPHQNHRKQQVAVWRRKY
jgi:hypothetical protein